jgi:hypothetical protein
MSYSSKFRYGYQHQKFYFIVLLLTVNNITIICNSYNQSILHLQVKVNVVDVNDNRPHFIFPNAKFNGKYFGAIPVDSQIGTIVLQVKLSCLITICCYNDSYICGECKNTPSTVLLENAVQVPMLSIIFSHTFLVSCLLL